MNSVLRHLRRAALLSAGENRSDAQLLEDFLTRRDDVAFESLLRRHGPMVLGVCRRVLRDTHDAEDAFQATFLVLARKAGSIRSKQVVASWLYGVAYRTAVKARAMNAKRRSKEKDVGKILRTESSADEELLARLDYELNRLADKYRVPIVLCELEGRSRKEAARILGVPEGTLSSRLAQAKKLLGRRLSRYGAVAVVTLLSESAVSANLSPILRVSTTKAALAAGAVPANVLALTEGVIKAMLLNKLKITFCSGTLMLLAGIGASGMTYRAIAQSPSAQRPPQRETHESRSQGDELESLRLEIEALRKALQATRERVKSLEEEMGTMKRAVSQTPDEIHPRGFMGTIGSAASQPGGSQADGVRMGATSKSASPAPPSYGSGGSSGGEVPRTSSPGNPPPAMQATQPHPESSVTSSTFNPFSPPSESVHSSLSHAQIALKRLRENPKDTKSYKILEQALKQLKEQENPRPPVSPPNP